MNKVFVNSNCKFIDNFLNVNKKSVFCAIFVLFFSVLASSQSKKQQIEYIERHAAKAVEQQQKHGIPASITLAQGLLESGAGLSRLSCEGNNHFGIKWFNDSHGDSIHIGKTAYRKYKNVEQSFTDHSLFLKAKRYGRLFHLDKSDYQGWARGLKECGYATDPAYAGKLIAIVEMFDLNRFVGSEGAKLAQAEGKKVKNQPEGGKKGRKALPSYLHPVSRRWGLHCVKVMAGDTYELIAQEFNIKVSKLYDYNDINKKDVPELNSGDLIYLEKKHKKATGEHFTCEVREGETLWSIAQRYGMSLKSLCNLNDLHVGDTLTPGTVLRLQ